MALPPASSDAVGAATPRLSAVLDAVSSFVCLLSHDGRVLHANARLLEVSGLSPCEVTGRFLWDCPWWEDDVALQQSLRLAMDPTAEGSTPTHDVQMNTRHAGRRPMQLSLIPLRDEGSGSVAQWVMSAMDLSGQRAGEAERDRSEARFRHLFDGAPDGIVMVDAQGRISLINAAMERLFGYAREELVGQPIEMLIPARYLPDHVHMRERYMHTPTARDMASRRELYALRKDGSEFPAEVGLNPLHLPEGTFVVATVFDVSRRRSDEQALQRALAEKTALLNEVHHRVKNNLQVISSLLNLQARHAPPEALPFLAESQDRVKAMALIHQLLYERNDYSQVDLAYYLQRLGRLLRESLAAHRGRLLIETQAIVAGLWIDLEHAVPCGLIVNELVTNAVKHAFPEGRAGRIAIELEQHADGRCEVRVSDDGIGLPDTVQPGGTRSLGFKLIPILVEQLGGELAIEREGGTRFVLRFAPLTGGSG